MQQSVTVRYEGKSIFKLPVGLSLKNQNIENYWIKRNTLYIAFNDRKDVLKIEAYVSHPTTILIEEEQEETMEYQDDDREYIRR